MAPVVARLESVAKEILGWRPLPKRLRPHGYEQQCYAALVRPGDVCFDVGASTGSIAEFLARLTGKEGLVVAFEPVWRVYRDLCANLQASSYARAPIVTVPVGLSDGARTGVISFPDGLDPLGSLAPAEAWSEAWSVTWQADETESYDVALTTLDDFLEASALPDPDFLKIDVEGGELPVLRGAERLLSRARPALLVEVFAPWQAAFGYGPWDLLSLLNKLGYRFFFACPEGLVEYGPTESEPFPPAYEQGYNVIALVPDAYAERLSLVDSLRAESKPRLVHTPPPRLNRIP